MSDVAILAAFPLGGFLVGLFTKPRFALAVLALYWVLLMAWVLTGSESSETSAPNAALLATVIGFPPVGLSLVIGLGIQRLLQRRE